MEHLRHLFSVTFKKNVLGSKKIFNARTSAPDERLYKIGHSSFSIFKSDLYLSRICSAPSARLAIFLSKAIGLFKPSPEWRRRGL